MDEMTLAQYTARAKIIKAMAHPTRLFIVEELKNRERCVNELTEMIGADASTVSKHLTVLKNADLLIDRKEGASIYYTLRVPCILDFIGCIEVVMETKAKKQIEIINCCKK